jgi:hypothetical protein
MNILGKTNPYLFSKMGGGEMQVRKNRHIDK